MLKHNIIHACKYDSGKNDINRCSMQAKAARDDGKRNKVRLKAGAGDDGMQQS